MRRLKTIKIDGFPVSELKELPPPPPLWRSLLGAKLGVAVLFAAVYIYYVFTMVQQMRTAMANPLSRLDVSPVDRMMSPGLYFCIQNNVGSRSERARLTFDVSGCQIMRNGAFTGRTCPLSYSNLTITQVNYRMHNCGIIDPVLLTGGLDIDSDLINVRYTITRDPSQVASTAGGLLFSGTFKSRGANGEPIVDKLDLSQDYGVTLFRFRRTEVIGLDGSLSDFRHEVSVSNTPQCAVCSILGPTHSNVFILPFAWEVTTQTRYIGFGPLDLIGAITGVAGILLSAFFRCMGPGTYQDDGICQLFFPSCTHRLFYQQQAAKRLDSAYVASDNDDSGATELCVIPHGDIDVNADCSNLDRHGDLAECSPTSTAFFSLPPQFKHVPPAVQACVQSYHEQLAFHLANMHSIQKRMLADLGRLAAEPAESSAVNIRVQEPSRQSLPQELRSLEREEERQPKQSNRPVASRAALNLPATVFPPGNSDRTGIVCTKNVLFSPGGARDGAPALSGPVASVLSASVMPPALDPANESRIDRPASGAEEGDGAQGTLTSTARVKRFLMRFKTRTTGDER
jgi:hypothetical protein